MSQPLSVAAIFHLRIEVLFMNKYLTVLGRNESEFTEKRSRFIATLCHCETEAEAMAFIDEMRSKYWDAKHNVYAYSVEKGRMTRFSDDGEPHGTAGKPVFDVLTGSGATDVAVVVTRYFGGILLGTGGLVRAYSKACKDALETAKMAQMIPCTVFETVCEYAEHQRLVSLIESKGGKIENTEFTDKIRIEYCFKDSEIEGFMPSLCENFSARLEAVESGKKVTAFEISENL